jgi:ferric-dicitrate binding protein FerR (iron transport regulator)
MQSTGNKSTAGSDRDPVAELIRTTGRRLAPPAGAREAVRLAALEAWQAKLRARRNRRLRVAAAASFAVVLGFAAVLPRLMEPDSSPAGTIARAAGVVTMHGADGARAAAVGATLDPGERLSTAADGGLAIALAGGASLRVAAESMIVLEAAGAVNLLAGAIYVDSGDDVDAAPLAVTTAYGTVTDIGTQFEVRDAGTALRVRVRSGLVRVSRTGAYADVNGAAGDELRVASDGAVGRRRVSPTDASWQWVETLAVAPASGFGSIRACLDWIARETGRAVRYDSESTEIQAELRDLSGNPAGLQPMEVLELIRRISDFDYEIDADDAILISRN